MPDVNANPIKAARKARGWTQQELAHHAGLTVKTVVAAEKGAPVRRTTVRVIEVALGLPAGALEPSRVAVS